MSFWKLQVKLFNEIAGLWSGRFKGHRKCGSLLKESQKEYFSTHQPPKKTFLYCVPRARQNICKKNFASYFVYCQKCWPKTHVLSDTSRTEHFRWEFMILREFCESGIYITSAEIEWISKIPLRMRNMNPDINSIFSQDCKFRFNSILFQQLRMDCALGAELCFMATAPVFSMFISWIYGIYLWILAKICLQFNVLS